jgi:hypothetical protein
VNPLSKYSVYAERNMVNIYGTISVNICITLDVVENIFINVDCSQYEIRQYMTLFKEFCDVFD